MKSFKNTAVYEIFLIIFGLSWITGSLSQQNATFSNNSAVRYTYSCLNNTNPTNSRGQYVVVKTERIPLNHARFTDELVQVKNSGDMKEFLEKNVQWNVRLYDPENITSSGNISNFSNDQLCALEKNTKNLFVSDFCRFCEKQLPSDNDNFNYYLENYYVIFVILGVLSLFGNGIAIIHEIQTLITQKSKTAKERNVYNILVINLCLADLLMGIYLIAFPIALKKLKEISISFCNTLGVVSVLSIQVSVSILVIITGFRLYGIIFPYKRIHVKLAIILLVLVWILWLFVASLPVFNVPIFAHEFTRVIDVNDSTLRQPLTRVAATVRSLASNMDPADEPLSQVLRASNIYASNQVSLQLLHSFNLVNFTRDKVDLVKYYSPSRGCTIEMFVNVGNTATAYFSFSLLICNLAGFLFILFAYFIMLRNISASRFKSMLSCLSKKNFFKKRMQKSRKIKSENRQVYVRIFAVVITDLVCGIPVCLTGLGYFFEGLSMTTCFVAKNLPFKELAPLMVLILFPLNSVINPYIYSFHLWKKLCNRCKRRLIDRNFSSIHSANTQISTGM